MGAFMNLKLFYSLSVRNAAFSPSLALLPLLSFLWKCIFRRGIQKRVPKFTQLLSSLAKR